MGYTHYFYRPTELTKDKWDAAVADCKKIVGKITEDRGIGIQFEYDKNQLPQFDSSLIRFNGIDRDGHETFFVQRVYHGEKWETQKEDGLWFAFCKTAGKPYDLHVCACLIALKHHLGDDFIVSSDGTDDEPLWVDARDFCQQHLGYGADFTIRRDSE